MAKLAALKPIKVKGVDGGSKKIKIGGLRPKKEQTIKVTKERIYNIRRTLNDHAVRLNILEDKIEEMDRVLMTHGKRVFKDAGDLDMIFIKYEQISAQQENIAIVACIALLLALAALVVAVV